MKRIAALLVALLFCPALADASGKFLRQEKEIYHHELALNQVAESLETWLSGRQTQKEHLDNLTQAQERMGPYVGLPSELGTELSRLESELALAVEQFAKSESPDAKGQRRLFSRLGDLNKKRNSTLLNWRQSQVAKLKTDSDSGRARYYQWEASWIPIWLEETKLTRELQIGLLQASDESQAEGKTILKNLLRLQMKASKLNDSDNFSELHKISSQRLTVLARTSEQLIRLKSRKSRGAVTRVRRLSRQLNQLTKDFQEKRMSLLKKL